MLQQTQVSTVLGYFSRFIGALPTLRDLAAAPEDQVLGLWTGLGYYSRARNLHKTAKQCVALHGGQVPNDFDALLALPGIGRSTAGAILTQAFERRFPILDGNVKRVLARVTGEREWTGLPSVEKRLWRVATDLLPDSDIADYTQALMDLGATVCTRNRPKCLECPVQKMCVAAANGETDQIPAPRPKKTIPERSGIVIWLRDAKGAHYLEKRSTAGIWGALWSLPQFDTLATAEIWLRERRVAGIEQLPDIRHAFTHFKLTLTPIMANVDSERLKLRELDKSCWADADTLATLGIPAPIRKLLESPP